MPHGRPPGSRSSISGSRSSIRGRSSDRRPSVPEDDDEPTSKTPFYAAIGAIVLAVALIGFLMFRLTGGGSVVVVTTPSQTGHTSTSANPTVPGNRSPRAEIRLRIDPKTPYIAEFSGDFSDDSDPEDEGRLSFAWDFGDGTTGTEAMGSKSYAAPGTYTIVLKVSDRSGASSTARETVTLKAPDRTLTGVPKPPQAIPGLLVQSVEQKMKTFADLAEVWTGVAGTVASKVDIAHRPRKEWYALRFTGYLEFPADGIYVISIGSDDGSRLTLAGKRVANMNTMQSITFAQVHLQATAGLVPIEIEYFQGTSDAELRLTWEGPGGCHGEVPKSAFWHEP